MLEPYLLSWAPICISPGRREELGSSKTMKIYLYALSGIASLLWFNLPLIPPGSFLRFIFTIIKNLSNVILQFLSFDWLTGNGI